MSTGRRKFATDPDATDRCVKCHGERYFTGYWHQFVLKDRPWCAECCPGRRHPIHHQRMPPSRHADGSYTPCRVSPDPVAGRDDLTARKAVPAGTRPIAAGDRIVGLTPPRSFVYVVDPGVPREGNHADLA